MMIGRGATPPLMVLMVLLICLTTPTMVVGNRDGCTAVVVGRAASVDGSLFTTHNNGTTYSATLNINHSLATFFPASLPLFFQRKEASVSLSRLHTTAVNE
jgi:hypothetical protein